MAALARARERRKGALELHRVACLPYTPLTLGNARTYVTPNMYLSRLRACVLVVVVGVAGCGPSGSSGPKVGTLTGTIDNTRGTSIGAGVTVTATDASTMMTYVATTPADGTYTISEVPVGSGTITLSTLPTGCATPPALGYTIVHNGGTKIENITVACMP